MIKQSALLAALALATGCAHHTSENHVVVSEGSSPYVAGGTYNMNTVGTRGYGTYYGSDWNGDYDNTSKGAGARAMMANPYRDNRTYYSTAPAGAAVTVGTDEETTSKGAGARELTQDSSVRDDASFVREAAQAGLAEVRMGELAEQNAQAQDLKDFGQRLVADHTKANDELMRIAQQKGMQAPTIMSQQQQGMIDHLSSLNGPQFDKDCGRHAVEAHERAVRLFRTEAQSGQDPDLKAFAQKMLPTLEEHLRMARELNKSAGHE